MSADGEINSFVAAGSHLGWAEFSNSVNKVALKEGDRILLFTDGVYEEPCLNGKELGVIRFAKLFRKTHGMPVHTALEFMKEQLLAMYASPQTQDDPTIVLIEIS